MINVSENFGSWADRHTLQSWLAPFIGRFASSFDYRLPAPIAKVGRFPLNWCVSAIQPVICCGFFFPSSLKQAHTENLSSCTCTLSRAVNGGRHWLLLKSIALLVHYSFVLADPPMCLLLLWSPSRGRQKWRPKFTLNPTFKALPTVSFKLHTFAFSMIHASIQVGI